MRAFSALIATALFAASTLSFADGITFKVSAVATGAIGADSFTDQRVTVSSYLSAQSLSAALPGGFFGGPNTPNSFTFGLPDGLVTTVSVSGVGSFNEVANFYVSGANGVLQVGDVEGHLSIANNFTVPSFMTSAGPTATQADVEDTCLFNCPGSFQTSGGDLTIGSYEPNSGIAQTIVTSSAPEPSPFALFGTGLIGLAEIVRRKISQKAR
jgi:hypothetical protein